jgi:uncharacterized protein YegP (UPF0339 family)
MDRDLRAELYRDAKGEWRWRVHAANGRIVADSGEGYKRKDDCAHGLRLVTGVHEYDEQESGGQAP